MHLQAFRTLFNHAGEAALQAALELSPRDEDYLSSFQVLCRRFPPDLAQAALETAILRHAGAAKFPFAERMYFTHPALEQASAWEVSSYRLERYQPFPLALDLGCSIGGDTLALASATTTVALDRDPLRLAMAQANLRALNPEHPAAFVQADLLNPLPIQPKPDTTALFFDPARRQGGKRLRTVNAYEPPLSIINTWLPQIPAAGVKISPGVDLAELAGYDAEIEFISLRGELKECALWFGPLKTTRRRATLLPGPHTLCTLDEVQPSQSPARLPLSDPLSYLYEPDPAILRAGLVADLGLQLSAAQLDPDIAYLTTPERIPTPFARCWQLEAWFPFSLKRLRLYLRQRGVGRVTVKKRGSPLQPEELIHALRLAGEAERVIFLTHLRGEPVVIVGLPYS